MELIMAAVGFGLGYAAGRYLPVLIRVLPAALILANPVALPAATHGHGVAMILVPWFLYILGAFIGGSAGPRDTPRRHSWMLPNLDLILFSLVCAALGVLNSILSAGRGVIM
jgi:hypothetical protein